MTGRKDPSKYKFTEERKKEHVKIDVYWSQEGRTPKNISFTEDRKEEPVKI